MDKYIYFATEMPLLKFGSEKFPSKDDFLAEAEKWMSPKDLSALVEVDLNDYSIRDAKGIYAGFLEFEYAIRRELAAARKAAKEGHEYKSSLLPASFLKEGTPLEREKKILSMHWDWLEDAEFGHYSDWDFFCIYFLKLQILERLSVFDQKEGHKAFETAVEKSIEQKENAAEAAKQ